jgi:putative phosphoribosyl transferase
MHIEKLKNRTEAGQLLAKKLKQYKNSDSVVLAIPRGGVAVGYEIAKELHLPLDIVLSKKIGHPNNEEYAIGAVSMDSILLDEHPEVSKVYIQKKIEELQKILQKKYQLYSSNQQPIELKDKNVIVVDDGIATGNTLLACLTMIRKKNPATIIVAVPVLPSDTVSIFQKNSDEFVYLIASNYFRGIGEFYDQFDQVEDTEAIEMLNQIRHNQQFIS